MGGDRLDFRDADLNIKSLRNRLQDFLKLDIPEDPVPFETLSRSDEGAYHRSRIVFKSPEGDPIPAFLLLPAAPDPCPAVLVHHQHHGQRHLGKSEVCGLAGDPLQAFGPALARKGIAVLAPDSICFEDRRRNRGGTEPDEAADVAQHYDEMCYRLLRGDTLMRKVLSDSAQAISLLRSHPQIDGQSVGALGHSYGGNTVLFHGALDERIRFACASGAASSYEYKFAKRIGIEMAEVIPGFASLFDIPDLVVCFSPRQLLLLSATNDPFSQDADRIVVAARQRWEKLGAADRIEHLRYQGEHALTPDRFEAIVRWVNGAARDPA